MADQKDLFKHVHELPPNVQAILVDYAWFDTLDEQQIKKMSDQLYACGYTFDFSESRTPTNLRLLEPSKGPTILHWRGISVRRGQEPRVNCRDPVLPRRPFGYTQTHAC